MSLLHLSFAGLSDTSVQIPCVSSLLTLFILKKNYQQKNEQQFSIHFAEDLEQVKSTFYKHD